MPASPSIFMSRSAPSLGAYLGAERLRAGLEACGYRCTAVVLPGTHAVLPGCTVSLQFGDRIDVGAGGKTRLTLRCSIRINGGDERVRGATSWQIRKLFPAPIEQDQVSLAIEADLILGGDIRLADVLTHGGDVYRHLHMLIGDASATLRSLSPHDSRKASPIMRIEAKFFGNLAAGRSGLLASREAARVPLSAGAAAHHLRITRAACDWLKDDVLPDLASAVRRMALRAQTTPGYRPATNAKTEQSSDDRSPTTSWLHNPSPQSAEEGTATPANATLVSAQVQ